ncbi:hypothetical protein L9F63_005194, partial [Diploptera punctata]
FSLTENLSGEQMVATASRRIQMPTMYTLINLNRNRLLVAKRMGRKDICHLSGGGPDIYLINLTLAWSCRRSRENLECRMLGQDVQRVV